KGTFHVVGYSPDGDSVRFQADDRGNWELLDGPPVQLNARGHAQLRVEAIDTLETHYQGHHQPLQLANDALHCLLDELGIKEVKSSLRTTARAVTSCRARPKRITGRCPLSLPATPKRMTGHRFFFARTVWSGV